MKIGEHLKKYRQEIIDFYTYCMSGVWNDTRRNYFVDSVKIINLSINSFLDKNLQQKASSLTYNTLLAIIPALALLFAIGRGFGFQNLLQSELFKYLPAQKEVLSKAFTFVESYLEQSSQGIFLGIGIIFLLWTLISLILNVEEIFNHIWGIRKGRSLYRKITDYIAIFLILPILMICEGGITIYMSSVSVNSIFSPIMKICLDILPSILTWFFFAGAFVLIPNTKVKFTSALLSGILCGSAFQVIQWLFVSGQIYVSKYNAIYGSFAFIPLLLIWLQLTWVITLGGVVLTYSAQNIFRFNFGNNIKEISPSYYQEISIIIMRLIIERFETGEKPYSTIDLSTDFEIPFKLVSHITDRLADSDLIITVVSDEDETKRYIPAADINKITLGYFIKKITFNGKSNFLKDFDNTFKDTIKIISNYTLESISIFDHQLIKDIPLNIKSNSTK